MSRDQKSRITALMDQPPPGRRPSDDAYHLYQAKRCRAVGGVWGSFFTGQPTDDLAAYSCPRRGAISSSASWASGSDCPALPWSWASSRAGVAGTGHRRGDSRAVRRLLAAGITTLFAVEVLINTGMTVGLLPITGLSLPLVSHGGSGLLAHAVALGLLLNVGLRPGYEVTNEPFRYEERE